MAQRPLAIFTIACNEPFFYPMWSSHYGHHARAADLFVLSDNNYRSDEFDSQVYRDVGDFKVTDVRVQAPKAFDHRWLRETVQAFQRFLLQTYTFVLFAEIDEFWAHPEIMLDDAVAGLNPGHEIFRARGYDVSRPPDLPPLPERSYDKWRPLLRDHDRWAPSRLYSKPTLATVPCVWTNGFHDLVTQHATPTDLVLVHCHKYDFAAALSRSREIKEREWSQAEVDARLGWQNRIADEDQMRTYFERDIDDPKRVAPFEPIPEWARRRV